ncbi:MAG TPA: hypothetical protein VMF90_12180 [Rhizobiaceae bacterium]|nr:hypothetical protein [Rhizobiaceae bacterium]
MTAIVPRRSVLDTALALLSLSQTQRRLAHRYKRDALEYERRGNLPVYREMRSESDRLWNEALLHFYKARCAFDRMALPANSNPMEKTHAQDHPRV